MPIRCFDTPTGSICVTEHAGAITRVAWDKGPAQPSRLLDEAQRQIAAYFAGALTRFDLPLHMDGSETQQMICNAIAAIPFGDTRSYGDLAKALSLPAQTIGGGCGRNPIPLIIPCHRVLGANGLGGFSGGTGIETKIALLKHEGAAGLLI